MSARMPLWWRRFAEIDNQALAEQGIEQGFQHPGQPRSGHNIPGEESVVECHRQGVAGKSDQTFEPPVRRVQGVGMVSVIRSGRTGRPQQGAQLPAMVNADVSACGAGIFGRNSPADPLRPAPRNTYGQNASRLDHPQDFGGGGAVIPDMFEHFRADDPVEGAALKRQPQDIRGRQRPDASAVFSQAVVQFKPSGGFAELREVTIGSDDPDVRQTVCMAGMATRAAADIQNPLVRFDLQPVEIHGDQKWPPGTPQRWTRRFSAR